MEVKVVSNSEITFPRRTCYDSLQNQLPVIAEPTYSHCRSNLQSLQNQFTVIAEPITGKGLNYTRRRTLEGLSPGQSPGALCVGL